MNLYIVDFHYHDEIEGEISDRWTLGCKSDEEVDETMQRNFKALESHGFKPLSYSFQRVRKTNNGFNVSVG